MPQDGYTGVSVPDEDYEQASELKPDTVTWGDVLLTGAEQLSYDTDAGPATNDTDADELVDRIIDTIGAEVGGPRVDDSEIAREVSRQIDYAELSKRVADELEGRMR